jgi:hypothetical protein
MVAHVRFVGEPKSRKFGTKQARDGSEIDDIRYFATVEYLGGTARSKSRDGPVLPAKKGKEFTLWMGSTLKGAILDGIGWQDGDPDPILKNTTWKIWRGETGTGGHRVYEALLYEGDEPEDTPLPSDDEATIELLKEAIMELEEIDIEPWYDFCETSGAEDGEAITKKMVEMGIVELTDTMVKAVVE